MGLFVAIFLIQLSIVLHEVGHALAFRARGIKIEMIALGIPVIGIPQIVFYVRGVKVVISLLLVGGLVKIAPEGERQLVELSYGEQALISGAGILANLFFALALFMGIGIRFLWVGWANAEVPKALSILGIGIASAALLWFGRRIFCSYLFPALGVAQLLFLLYEFAIRHKVELSGPIGIGAAVVANSTSVLDAVAISALLSFAIGLTNTLPFVPLDGGQTLLAFIRNHRPAWENRVATIGLSVMVILIFVACFNDLYNNVHIPHWR